MRAQWAVAQSVILGMACFTMLLSWLLPSHFRPWATAYQELLSAIALVLFFSVALLCRGMRVPISVVMLSSLAFVPFGQLQAGILSYAGDAWVSASYIMILAISVFVGYNLNLNSQKRGEFIFSERIAWVLLLAGTASSVLAVIQWLGFSNFSWVSPIKNTTRPFANLAQPNNLATLLGMGLMSLLYLFEKRKLFRLSAVLLALLLLFALTLAQSRAQWVSAVFIFGFWFWQRGNVVLRLTNQQMLLWMLIYIAMIVSVPLLAEYLEISRVSLLDRLQKTARLDLYQQFVTAVLYGPWYGYGWNQVLVAQAAISSQYAYPLPTLYTHNILLDLLIWNGPVLGGGIILLVAIWLWKLLKGARSLTATYAWVALSCFIFHSMLEYPHAYLFLLIPAGLLLGVLQSEVSGYECSFYLSPVINRFSFFASAMLIMVMWRDYCLIEQDYHKAVVESNDEFVPEVSQGVYDVYLLNHMRAYIYFVRAPLRADYSESALSDALTVAHRFPYFYCLLKGAYIAAMNNRVDDGYDLLLLIEGLYGSPKLDQSLAYFVEKSESFPELLNLVRMFD